MEKQNNSVGKTVLIVLLLIVTIISLVLATYAWAKYTSEATNGTANAVVAKWNVNGSATGNLTWSQTYTNVVDQKLAPGTEGKMPITFSVNDTEVEVKFTISLTGYTNKPTNLKLYGCDANGNRGTLLVDAGTAKTTNESFTAKVVYTGTINPAAINNSNETVENKAKAKTYTGAIYYEWDFETGTNDTEKAANDITDTADGVAAMTDANMSLTLKIDAEQVRPTV